jgi:hypothetical protein
VNDQADEIVDIIAAQITGQDFHRRNNGNDARHSRRVAEEIVEALRSRGYTIRKTR